MVREGPPRPSGGSRVRGAWCRAVMCLRAPGRTRRLPPRIDLLPPPPSVAIKLQDFVISANGLRRLPDYDIADLALRQPLQGSLRLGRPARRPAAANPGRACTSSSLAAAARLAGPARRR